MVLRKPDSQGNLVPAPLSQAANNPPYPVSPSSEVPPSLPQEYSPDPNRPPAFALKTPDEPPKETGDHRRKEEDGSDYSSSEWERSDDEDSEPEDLPGPLKIGGGKPIPSPSQKKGSLPDVLKAGPPPGIQHKKSYEMITPEPTGASAASWGGMSNSSGGSVPLQTNNPYLRMQHTGQSNYGVENSQQAWADVPSHAPSHAPSHVQKYEELAELPSTHTPDTPTDHMAQLSVNSNVPSQPQPKPEQPPLIAVESPTPQQTPQTAMSPQVPIAQRFNTGMDVNSIDAWARKHGLPTETDQSENSQRTWQEHQNWTQNERDTTQQPGPSHAPAAFEPPDKPESEVRREEYFTPTEQAPGSIPASSPFEEEQTPALPPRQVQDQEVPPPMPPRPIDTTTGVPPREDVESPNTVMNRQRKEHYPIKHIRWLDATTSQIRESPILTQNVNGPCPLLALVNALVLSTPAGLKTEFVETLRTREQVSLGLLVDAVIEELMSGRRGTELGDVNELYRFLIGLQTGMNVNPMFVHDPEADDGSSVHNLPGGFEKTRDMRLYRTFNMPLIHGWLPEPGSEAYTAFDRVAKTYETAQYVQFQEEELEAKLQAEGLNADEQRLFTDIHAIKEFLSRWPTQLTDYGLRNMQQAIKPGEVGILFRNDHFSTLYKNPHTNELMTLVTDQGYASHDEIVWESLVDVSGRGSELYSGDFRAVGNNSLPQRPQQQQQAQSLLDLGDDGWTTVTGNRRRNGDSSSSVPVPNEDIDPSAANPDASRTEQEDHDLALALQLQEEEEDRHRRSLEERRRRENQLSENAISSQAQSRPGNRRGPRQSEYPPLIPPRRNNVQTSRPNNEAVPPPTYEEAATSPQYHPPQGHPANPNTPFNARPGPQGGPFQPGGPNVPLGQAGRRPSGRPMGNVPQMLPPRPGRRQSGVVGPNGQEEREKCVVM